ncbi:3-galactosyl-N-acetylglucosaminide 4-alpha-L-fucosyltransferase FUT3-like [Liolophura sinensis]|uniref:3-galactosyl-N-acetylglucosaminide 4-alpha-L-fucosyltransferase FUT3-like n=1 Tax=Liolophura sinensis TaxID=3198878 RepID=UPI0031582701
MTMNLKDLVSLRRMLIPLLMICFVTFAWQLDVMSSFTLDPKVLYLYPSVRPPNISRNQKLEHIDSSLTPETNQKHNQMRNAYLKRLAGLPRPEYRSAKLFKEFGEPVYKMLPSNSTRVKKILMWTGFFGNTSFIPKNISIGKNRYCIGTHNRTQLLSSDLVIMHARDMKQGAKSLPPERRPFQRWAYFVLESPFNRGLDVRQFNGIFNWTLTYRDDTDVAMPYFHVRKRERPLTPANYRELYANIYRSKSKLISYVNSHCHTPHSKRLEYMKELSQYIPVDMYGGCFKLKCHINTEDCTNLLTQYKFYLAMENGNCRDYITEKVGQPLFVWKAVPVVMGGGDPSDYERHLPPGSYIHSSGFESPEHLANYLLFLDKNPALYEMYHQWRKTHDGDNDLVAGFRDVCQALYDGDTKPSQTYRDFSEWYAEDTCKP